VVEAERRSNEHPDRRGTPRGGRRLTDAPGACPTVLVVEDEAPIRTLLVRQLSRFGFRAEGVGDGLAAFTLVPTLEPQLIITDIRLPHMSGLELLARLADDPRTQQIPVVMFTAEVNAAEAAARLGCAAFVSKPATPQVLLERVREVLRARPVPDT